MKMGFAVSKSDSAVMVVLIVATPCITCNTAGDEKSAWIPAPIFGRSLHREQAFSWFVDLCLVARAATAFCQRECPCASQDCVPSELGPFLAPLPVTSSPHLASACVTYSLFLIGDVYQISELIHHFWPLHWLLRVLPSPSHCAGVASIAGR